MKIGKSEPHVLEDRSDSFEPTLNAGLSDAHEEAASDENPLYESVYDDSYNPEGEWDSAKSTSESQITTATGNNEPDR